MLWEEYVEPAFRQRIPQVVKAADGIDRIQVEGKILAGDVLAMKR